MKKIFTLLFVVSGLYASATIHHTWNISDQIGAGAFSYDLDLNGDNDFSFQEQGSQYLINSISINNKYAAEGGSGSIPKAYSDGASLGTYHWQNGQGSLMDWSSNTGNFYNVDKYVMVRFLDGSNVYYGWFYLQGAGDYIWVEGYAYNDVPNEEIKAGQTVAAVAELENAAAIISKLSRTHFVLQDCSAFDRVQMFNFSGQLLSDVSEPQPNVSYSIADNVGEGVMAFYSKNELLFTHRYRLGE